MKIVTTAHAATRFRQRFRLRFHPDVFRDKREYDVLKSLFEKAKQVDFALKQKIGLYNAICVKNEAKVDYHIYNDLILFVSCIRDGRRMLLTVMHPSDRIMGHSFI